MIIDLRTYTMVPGASAPGSNCMRRRVCRSISGTLVKPIGVFTTDVGTVNQVVFFWGFESQADRERRRNALEADPDWVAYRQKSAEAGNVQHQECKIIKSTKFSPM